MLNIVSGMKTDIQVDNQQRIKTTLRVLNENMNEFIFGETIDQIGIKSSGRRVSTESTYEEAKIYTGDILLIGIDQEQEGWQSN